MKNKRTSTIIIIFIFSTFVVYFAYRVHYALQLNLSLEAFMAKQIILFQEDNFKPELKQRPKTDNYFVIRHEPFLIYIGNRTIESRYDSYWIAHAAYQQQVSSDDYFREYEKYTDGILAWHYSAQPLSGSIVCVMLEAYKPGSWTANGYGRIGFSGTYTIDTSKTVWQLQPYDLICKASYTDIIQRSLLSVH